MHKRAQSTVEDFCSRIQASAFKYKHGPERPIAYAVGSSEVHDKKSEGPQSSNPYHGNELLQKFASFRKSTPTQSSVRTPCKLFYPTYP